MDSLDAFPGLPCHLTYVVWQWLSYWEALTGNERNGGDKGWDSPPPPHRIPFLEETVFLREYSSCPEGCASGSQHSQDSSNTISSLCFQFRREKCLLLLLCVPVPSDSFLPDSWLIQGPCVFFWYSHMYLWEKKTQTNHRNGWPHPQVWPGNCALWRLSSTLVRFTLKQFLGSGDQMLSLIHIPGAAVSRKYCPRFLGLALNIAELRREGKYETSESVPSVYEYVQLHHVVLIALI